MEAGRLPPTLEVDEEHCTIIARVWKFSNTTIHDPSKTHHSDIDTSSPEYSKCASNTVVHFKRGGVREVETKFVAYDISNEYFEQQFETTVYPNGRGSSDEGTLSIEFCAEDLLTQRFQVLLTYVELTCVIGVIDVEGDRRFTQSFAFSRDVTATDFNERFVIENFISRSVLLKEPRELLPNDTLTLHMDVILREHVFKNDLGPYEEFLTEDLMHTSDSCYLRLNSNAAKILAEESRFFERLLETPMMEKSSGRMRIQEDEYESFTAIATILLHGGGLCVDSVDEILDLYTTADMYGLPTVVDTCRCWLKLCISSENVLEISEFADWFDDECLKKIVDHFHGTHRDDEGIQSIVDVRQDWICEPRNEDDTPGWNFYQKYWGKGETEGGQSEENDQSAEKVSFNFYS